MRPRYSRKAVDSEAMSDEEMMVLKKDGLVLALKTSHIRFAVDRRNGITWDAWGVRMEKSSDAYIYCRGGLRGQKVSLPERLVFRCLPWTRTRESGGLTEGKWNLGHNAFRANCLGLILDRRASFLLGARYRCSPRLHNRHDQGQLAVDAPSLVRPHQKVLERLFALQ